METADRRRTILNAALRCFLARGYLATSIADIRRASGASTGSIYHFFANKGAIAAALLDEAIGGWSAAAGVPPNEDAPAREAITASVRGLVEWGTANLPLLRFMDEIRTLADSDPGFRPVRTALEGGRLLGAARYGHYLARGEVRALPWPVAHALMLGPAYDYLRLVADGYPPDAAAPDLLAAAAWDAVRAPIP